MIVRINNKKFKIRKCKEDDFEFVYDLLKENMYELFVKHWGKWDENVFKENFNKENIKIVEHKGKRVAFFDIEFKKNYSYVNNIQISDKTQNKGLGTFLFNLIERKTKNKNLDKIRLKVFKDNPAKNFYKKLGYKKLKEKDNSLILEKGF